MAAAVGFRKLVAAELRLLSRRPAVHAVLVGILLLNALPGYLAAWATMTFTGWGPRTAAMAPAITASHAHVSAANQTVVSGILAVALGALVVGGDYAWSTGALRALHTADRLRAQAARLAALAVVLAAMTAAVTLFLLVAMAAFTAVMPMPAVDLPAGLPPPHRLLAALGLGWLILLCWATAGAVLAAALRSAAAGWGVGIVYVFGVERLLASTFDVSPIIEMLGQLTLTSLGRAAVFVLPERAATDALDVSARLLDPVPALAVLLVATAALVAGTVLLPARQDL